MADLQEMPGGVDTAELQNRAYQGADEGSGAFSRVQDQGDGIESLEVAYILRPQVAMGYLEGLPYVVSLGIREVLDRLCADEMRIGWPYAVVHDTRPLVSLETHAGYGKGGIFAVARLTLPLKALDEGMHACALLEECRVTFQTVSLPQRSEMRSSPHCAAGNRDSHRAVLDRLLRY